MDLPQKNVHTVHANYVFLYHDSWVDVHVSLSNPDNNTLQLLEVFDTSLKYGSQRSSADK